MHYSPPSIYVDNIVNALLYLKQDFTGFNLDIGYLLNVAEGFVIAVSLIYLTLLLGKTIKKLFFKDQELTGYNFLVEIGLGYIIVATGIGFLGFFSLLNSVSISLYLFGLVLFVATTTKKSLLTTSDISNWIKKITAEFDKNKLIFSWIILFIFMASVNLINPEIREDQYHVDLPAQFLKAQTIMIPSRETQKVSASPLLGEMYYTIGIFFGSKESARSIHFIFYLLVLATLFYISKKSEHKFAIYAPLIFASAPLVIHETSSMYVDFQWLLCFLLSLLFLIKKDRKKSDLALSGIFWGGMLATKLWTIAFSPVPIIYLFITYRRNIFIVFKKSFIFISFTLLISALWYLRSYLLMGNPFYPAFQNHLNLFNFSTGEGGFDHIGFNYGLFTTSYLNVFSPLFFLGLLLFLFKLKNEVKRYLKLDLFIIFTIYLIFIIFFVPYFLGRYLFGFYVLAAIFASAGLYNLIQFKVIKYAFNIILIILFSYYFLSSLLIMPYSLGFADKNNYLSRVLVRDYFSYYDFAGKFDKHFDKNDLVATYNSLGYYYAHFNYVDAHYIFEKKGESFLKLKEKGVTKLFLKGGDISWFCKDLNLRDCSPGNYYLISEYLPYAHYYLYGIK